MFWGTLVINTAVGYQGGFTPNPAYEEVCPDEPTRRNGPGFDPDRTSYERLVRQFL